MQDYLLVNADYERTRSVDAESKLVRKEFAGDDVGVKVLGRRGITSFEMSLCTLIFERRSDLTALILRRTGACSTLGI